MLEISPNTNRVGTYIPSNDQAVTARNRNHAGEPERQSDGDVVEVSEAARAGSAVEDTPVDDRVARVRAEIAAGTYLSEERVNVAVERLFSELAG